MVGVSGGACSSQCSRNRSPSRRQTLGHRRGVTNPTRLRKEIWREVWAGVPQGDDLNCRMRRLGGDEKRDLVTATDMFTGAGAVFVEIVLDYSYSKALVPVVRGDASPVLGHAKVDMCWRLQYHSAITPEWSLTAAHKRGVRPTLSGLSGLTSRPSDISTSILPRAHPQQQNKVVFGRPRPVFWG